MKEINISFSPTELRELTKLITLGLYVTGIIDEENEGTHREILNRVCGIGLKEAPETGAFGYGGYTETIFCQSRELDKECNTLLEIFEGDFMSETLPYELADRDFIEQYGNLEPKVIFNDPVLKQKLLDIQKIYVDNYETYGIQYLRLQQP